MMEESCQEARKHTEYDGDVQEVCDSVKNEDFLHLMKFKKIMKINWSMFSQTKKDDTVAQGLLNNLNVVKVNPWDWKYIPKRKPGKKVWGRY